MCACMYLLENVFSNIHSQIGNQLDNIQSNKQNYMIRFNVNKHASNIKLQFLYPPKLLPKNESPQEGAITFTKNIVEKLKHSGEDNVTKFLHALLKKYDKITTSSFKISSTSDAWKRTTIKNISECFSISKDLVLLGEYAI